MRQNQVIEAYVSWTKFIAKSRGLVRALAMAAITIVNMLRQEARAKKPHRTQGILSCPNFPP